MPSKKTRLVNLDALIPRADFETTEDISQSSPPSTIQIRDLERASSFFFGTLRKPDFQRETASWEPEKVREFIKTFIEGDLIPAIILWRSPGGTFIIDGAHRLSALIAWVDNDFGDGTVSTEFFGGIIPDDQRKFAEQARKIIHKEFRTYQEHLAALKSPDTANPEVKARAFAFGQRAIQLQWVPGNALKAESSFFKINRSATLIQETELEILVARRKPNGLAARAMLRAGRGYKYWQHFAEDKQKQIEESARHIYDQLWTPILTVPIKTLDLPVAGANYSAYTLPLLFQFISLANEETLLHKKITTKDIESPNGEVDKDGDATIEHLPKVRKIADRISSKDYPGSLGLHPAIYFYSDEGRFQPTAFLAVVRLITQFEKEDLFADFTTHRKRFEEFLVKYKTFSNQVTAKWGSGIKSFDKFHDLLRLVLDHMIQGDTDDEIVQYLSTDPVFLFLSARDEILLEEEIGKDFNVATQSKAFLKIALSGAIRCAHCGGYLDKKFSIDHKIPKKEGGKGHLENAQLMHLYCNTTAKN